ncbi:transcriptional adapter 2A isoform X1 [Phlebotomus argentipes]|uniref:transcriptional adapter 2A isoform X1 n=1 Tax=Phlebotomus argentipes TaxID=94469 RepID=UPI0028932464|nr:transcriptional adapter 2A isoform X1 [Phlebotomus argentipes]
MAHPSVDLVEEDAADLQFPKGNVFPESLSLTTSSSVQTLCNYCCVSLSEPFIECVDCREMFCLSCFSSGVETQCHRNFHSYTFRRDDFPIFRESSWTGREEKLLLDTIMKCGFGNWSDASKFLDKYSSIDCRNHYFNFYAKGFVGKMSGIDVDPYERRHCPYWARRESAKLVRFLPEELHTKTLAGYCATRGEFAVPYDHTAERSLNLMDTEPWTNDEDTKSVEELNCGVFRAFNNRLRERHRRYRIIRDHGLLDFESSASQIRDIEEILFARKFSIEEATNSIRFGVFMQLLSAESFDLLVAGLKHAQNTKMYLHRLHELRHLGITSLHGGKLYHKLLAAREKRRKSEKTHKETLDKLMFAPGRDRKYNPMPMNIIGLSGYEKLSEEEREFCSNLRLQPDVFFTHRETLVSANAVLGYLPLSEARKLLKIDVNKTRKLYDYLVTKGLIAKPQT